MTRIHRKKCQQTFDTYHQHSIKTLETRKSKIQLTLPPTLPSDSTSEIQARLQHLLLKKQLGQDLEEVLHQNILEDAFPTSLSPNQKINDVNYHIFNVNCKDKTYTDITRQFTYRPLTGNKHICNSYHYDTNKILVTTVKNRKAETITAA